jgi:hypothetical protein
MLMGSQGWTVLVCASELVEQVAEELFEEFEFLASEEPSSTVRLMAMDFDGYAFLAKLTQAPPSSVCVVHAKAEQLISAIGIVEAARGRLVAGPNVVIITDDTGARTFAENAPNLWSWVGTRVWTHVGRIATANVDARLESLRAATGQTDSEVLRLAEAGQLNPDPVYAEWLALLGRGDLLGN